jgi:hypothetical protein
MSLVTPATVRWTLLGACAAALLVVHVALALRVRGVARVAAIAVPGEIGRAHV